MLAYFFPLVILGLMWVFLIRPQQSRMRERARMISSVSVGHRIVTAGGIHGTVVAVDEDLLSVEVAPGVELTIDRRAVGTVPSLDEADSMEDLDSGELD